MMENAYFAGGCFWCLDAVFSRLLPHPEQVLCGYMGGHHPRPTYQDICQGTTGHAEVVQLSYNSTEVSYSELLTLFWQNIDPTAYQRQFHDVGSQYRTAIFTTSEAQHLLATTSKEHVSALFSPVHTLVMQATTFHRGEQEHQKYSVQNPAHYSRYSAHRHAALQKIWSAEKITAFASMQKQSAP